LDRNSLFFLPRPKDIFAFNKFDYLIHARNISINNHNIPIDPRRTFLLFMLPPNLRFNSPAWLPINRQYSTWDFTLLNGRNRLALTNYLRLKLLTN
jgi:hypothetical protein